jgi:hypothetical protein
VAPKFFTKTFRQKKQGISAFLLGLFLSLQAMVVFPALHAMVHHDAGDPDHECAVTLFCHGNVEAATTAVPVFCAPAGIIFSQPRPETIFVSPDFRLLPGRGPPVFSALA